MKMMKTWILKMMKTTKENIWVSVAGIVIVILIGILGWKWSLNMAAESCEHLLRKMLVFFGMMRQMKN